MNGEKSPNSRQLLFMRFCKLWDDLYQAMPSRDLTPDEQSQTATLLAREFGKALDEYLKSEEARAKVFNYVRFGRF